MIRKFIIFYLSFIFSIALFGNSLESLEKSDAQFIENEKLNQGLFNPVEYSSFKGYRGEGSFVEAPARVGDWTGYIIGVLPAAVITEPFRLVPIAGYEGNNIGEYTLYGTTKTFGCLFGGLPFVFKSAFYDFPVWVFSSGSTSNVNTQLAKEEQDQQKLYEEIKRIENKKWETEEPKIHFTSISIKPEMLKINEEVLIKKGLIVKPELETQAEQKNKPEYPNWQELYESRLQAEPKTIKEDETKWDSNPILPDWVKKEMESQ